MKSEDQNQRRSQKKNILSGVARALLAGFLVWYVLSKVDLIQILDLRERISWIWVGAGALLLIVLSMLKAWQYYLFIGNRTSYWRILNIVVIQNSISNFVASSAGVVSYLAMFHLDSNVGVSRAAITFLLAKFGDIVSIWLYLLVSSLVLWERLHGSHEWLLILLVLMGSAITLFFCAILLRQWFTRVLSSSLEKLGWLQIRQVAYFADFFTKISELPSLFLFQTILRGILLSFVYMGVSILWFYIPFKIFSFEVELIQVVFVSMVIQMISYMPVQVFGGVGVNEATSLYFYNLLGTSHQDLAAVLVGSRILFYFMNLPVLLYLPVYSRWFAAKDNYAN